MIQVCTDCNARANRLVDRPLIGLDTLGRERAKVGVRDARTNQPSSFSETLHTDKGLKLYATWTQEGIETRFLPVELPVAGTNVVEVILDERDSEEQSRKQAERAARRGVMIGPPVDLADVPDLAGLPEPLDLAGLPQPLLAPGETAVFLAKPRVRAFPAWVWPAATAKITLGCLCHGAALALVRPETVHAITVYALRMLAFDHLYSPDVWEADDISPLPAEPARTHDLAGNLEPGQHLFALYGAEHLGQSSLAQLVLFGRFLIELPLPGISVRTPYGWLFSATARRVVHGTRNELAEGLCETSRSSQLALF